MRQASDAWEQSGYLEKACTQHALKMPSWKERCCSIASRIPRLTEGLAAMRKPFHDDHRRHRYVYLVGGTQGVFSVFACRDEVIEILLATEARRASV